MLSAHTAARTSTAKPIAAKAQSGYLNGSSIDGKTIETLARATDVVDPEPLDDDERFETRDKAEARGKTRPGPGPRG